MDIIYAYHWRQGDNPLVFKSLRFRLNILLHIDWVISIGNSFISFGTYNKVKCLSW